MSRNLIPPLHLLFLRFNEETYVYVLCIMCKSFMACLQMTNNREFPILFALVEIFLADDFSTNNPSSEQKKACCSGNFPGQVTNSKVGKTASKALGLGNSMAIVTVIYFVAVFQLLSNNRTPNLFINVKPAETALKRIHDRPTVISARHFKIWCVCCSSQCGCSVVVHCIVTAKGNTWCLYTEIGNQQQQKNTAVSLFPLLALAFISEDAPHSGFSFFGKMSLFRCGFSV